MVTALNIANNILRRALNENVPVSPMKLQKLLYFTYKHYYQTLRTPLFGERFEAWQYGPVLPSVYNEFKQYRDKPITDYSKSGDGLVWCLDEDNSEEGRTALNAIWRTYGSGDGIRLSTLTHQPGTAWDKAMKSNSIYLNDNDIAEELWYRL